jgi:hypothetical protein
MPGGKKLGEAVKADLDEVAKFYRTQARGNNREARRYERISKLMPDVLSFVAAVLSEEKLQEIEDKL